MDPKVRYLGCIEKEIGDGDRARMKRDDEARDTMEGMLQAGDGTRTM